MSSRKEVNQLMTWATDRGWKVSRTAKGHIRFDRPGHPVAFTSGTPSDHRTIKNTKAQILRAERQAESSDS